MEPISNCTFNSSPQKRAISKTIHSNRKEFASTIKDYFSSVNNGNQVKRHSDNGQISLILSPSNSKNNIVIKNLFKDVTLEKCNATDIGRKELNNSVSIECINSDGLLPAKDFPEEFPVENSRISDKASKTGTEPCYSVNSLKEILPKTSPKILDIDHGPSPKDTKTGSAENSLEPILTEDVSINVEKNGNHDEIQSKNSSGVLKKLLTLNDFLDLGNSSSNPGRIISKTCLDASRISDKASKTAVDHCYSVDPLKEVLSKTPPKIVNIDHNPSQRDTKTGSAENSLQPVQTEDIPVNIEKSENPEDIQSKNSSSIVKKVLTLNDFFCTKNGSSHPGTIFSKTCLDASKKYMNLPKDVSEDSILSPSNSKNISDKNNIVIKNLFKDVTLEKCNATDIGRKELSKSVSVECSNSDGLLPAKDFPEEFPVENSRISDKASKTGTEPCYSVNSLKEILPKTSPKILDIDHGPSPRDTKTGSAKNSLEPILTEDVSINVEKNGNHDEIQSKNSSGVLKKLLTSNDFLDLGNSSSNPGRILSKTCLDASRISDKASKTAVDHCYSVDPLKEVLSKTPPKIVNIDHNPSPRDTKTGSAENSLQPVQTEDIPVNIEKSGNPEEIQSKNSSSIVKKVLTLNDFFCTKNGSSHPGTISSKTCLDASKKYMNLPKDVSDDSEQRQTEDLGSDQNISTKESLSKEDTFVNQSKNSLIVPKVAKQLSAKNTMQKFVSLLVAPKDVSSGSKQCRTEDSDSDENISAEKCSNEQDSSKIRSKKPLIVPKVAKRMSEKNAKEKFVSKREAASRNSKKWLQRKKVSFSDDFLNKEWHKSNSASESEDDTNSKGRHECHVCLRSYVHFKSLKRHLNTHSKRSRSVFACQTCGQTFGQKSDLKKHMRLHKGKRKQVEKRNATDSSRKESFNSASVECSNFNGLLSPKDFPDDLPVENSRNSDKASKTGTELCYSVNSLKEILPKTTPKILDIDHGPSPRDTKTGSAKNSLEPILTEDFPINVEKNENPEEIQSKNSSSVLQKILTVNEFFDLENGSSNPERILSKTCLDASRISDKVSKTATEHCYSVDLLKEILPKTPSKILDIDHRPSRDTSTGSAENSLEPVLREVVPDNIEKNGNPEEIQSKNSSSIVKKLLTSKTFLDTSKKTMYLPKDISSVPEQSQTEDSGSDQNVLTKESLKKEVAPKSQSKNLLIVPKVAKRQSAKNAMQKFVDLFKGPKDVSSGSEQCQTEDSSNDMNISAEEDAPESQSKNPQIVAKVDKQISKQKATSHKSKKCQQKKKRSHEDDFQDKDWHKSNSASESDGEENSNSTTTGRHKCHICPRSYVHYKSLKRHINEHSEGSKTAFPCQNCGKAFSQRSDLKKHMPLHDRNLAFKCEKCGSCFTQSSALKRHERIHSNIKPFSCEDCGASFTQSGTLKRHQKIHKEMPKGAEVLKCEFCEDSFKEKHHLQAHVNSLHGNESAEKQRTYTCNICGATFFRHSSYWLHKKIHERNKSVDLKCEVCSKMFSTNSNLTRHFRTMHPETPENAEGERPFACSVCNERFSSAISLKRHMPSHYDKETHCCHICSKVFTHKQWLRRHLLLHPHNLRYACEQCGRSFRGMYQLGVHKRSTGGKCTRPVGLESFKAKRENLKYVCRYCNQRCSLSSRLAKHVRKHHPEVEVFTCDVCDKGFCYYLDFLSHRRTHRSIPYQCKTCEVAFPRRMELLEHCRMHLNSSGVSVAPSDTLDPSSTSKAPNDNAILEKSAEPGTETNLGKEPGGMVSCSQMEFENSTGTGHFSAVGALDAECLTNPEMPAQISESLKNPEVPEKISENLKNREVPEKISENLKNREVPEKISENLKNREVPEKISENLKNPAVPEKISENLKNPEVPEKISENLKNPEVSEKISKVLKCQSCRLVFLTKLSYWKHCRLVHDEKKYLCQICDKGFDQLARFKIHLKNFHPKPKKERKKKKSDKLIKPKTAPKYDPARLERLLRDKVKETMKRSKLKQRSLTSLGAKKKRNKTFTLNSYIID